MAEGAGPRLLGKLPAADTVRFTALASLFAIFLDAALGHGLLWENDPYWTYWVTKTFLLATIIGLGTAWGGIGAGRGAVVMGVHTLVLTVYYWTFSPVGLPSHPEWLDLEHTWVTGVPVHFGVLYLGYLSALWLWRRRQRGLAGQEVEPAALGTRALVVGVLMVVVAGGISSAALQEFPGVTWFLVRILLTVPLLMFWWAWAGRDATAAISGGLFLALVWGAYSQFLGPVGLPDADLRILAPTPPPATVRWLDYPELWLISFPIYVAAGALILLLDRRVGPSMPPARRLAPAAVLALALFTTAQTIPPEQRGQDARIDASGPVRVETGGAFSDDFEEGTGQISVRTTNMGSDAGARVTPLPPHDRIDLEASVSAGGQTFRVEATQPMVEDPLGRFGTWWGVGYHVEHHGRTGIGSSAIPAVKSELAAFALGELLVAGRRITGVPVHVMTAEEGLPEGGRLELAVGDPDIGPVEELPGGHLRVLWRSFDGTVPTSAKWARYGVGGAVVLVLLAAALALNRRELAPP